MEKYNRLVREQKTIMAMLMEMSKDHTTPADKLTALAEVYDELNNMICDLDTYELTPEAVTDINYRRYMRRFYDSEGNETCREADARERMRRI